MRFMGVCVMIGDTPWNSYYGFCTRGYETFFYTPPGALRSPKLISGRTA
jgi:hypothetical protein